MLRMVPPLVGTIFAPGGRKSRSEGSSLGSDTIAGNECASEEGSWVATLLSGRTVKNFTGAGW